MKTTAFLLVFAFLILDVRGKKKVDPDYFFKMSAAQICKPYFLQCKQNKGVSTCFQQLYNTCVPTYRKWLQSVERCTTEAGDDLEAVMSCANNRHAQDPQV